MKLMKFANQNPSLFVPNGSEIAYLLGLLQVIMAVSCETINVILLSILIRIDMHIGYVYSKVVI